jgi:hypothetical protein
MVSYVPNNVFHIVWFLVPCIVTTSYVDLPQSLNHRDFVIDGVKGIVKDLSDGLSFDLPVEVRWGSQNICRDCDGCALKNPPAFFLQLQICRAVQRLYQSSRMGEKSKGGVTPLKMLTAP